MAFKKKLSYRGFPLNKTEISRLSHFGVISANHLFIKYLKPTIICDRSNGLLPRSYIHSDDDRQSRKCVSLRFISISIISPQKMS
jgi:hypothetical protein